MVTVEEDEDGRLSLPLKMQDRSLISSNLDSTRLVFSKGHQFGMWRSAGRDYRMFIHSRHCDARWAQATTLENITPHPYCSSVVQYRSDGLKHSGKASWKGQESAFAHHAVDEVSTPGPSRIRFVHPELGYSSVVRQ